jgi:2Fe-2S ferredoxin
VKPKTTVSITFLPSKAVVEASHDETLLEAGLREEVEIPHSCGGNGTCGTCRVWVVQGLELLPERNEVETEMAQDRQFDLHERLCCQNYPVPGLVVEIPRDDLED